MKCKMLWSRTDFLVTLTFMLCICDLVVGGWIPVDSGLDEYNDDSIDMEAFHKAFKQLEEFMYKLENSVETFANDLCGRQIGRKQFRNGVTKKLRNGNDFFVYEFVEDMCRECDVIGCGAQQRILNSWVGMLFDLDGNGIIDNNERMYIDDR